MIKEFEFRPEVKIDEVSVVGPGPFGQRLISHVIGGEVVGNRLKGTIVGPGGDWALIGQDGFARIDVRLTFNEQVVGIGEGSVEIRNIYSMRTRTLGGFDSVVLACGSVSDSALYDELRTELPDVHVLGDAYAPRRLVFATRQAYALAEQLVAAATR